MPGDHDDHAAHEAGHALGELLVAMARAAARSWAAGHLVAAERYADAAFRLRGEREFTDVE